jgi:hypothetical protein
MNLSAGILQFKKSKSADKTKHSTTKQNNTQQKTT